MTGEKYIDKSRYMDINESLNALTALAQESRLAVFRLLVCGGEEGVPAGEIARSLGVPQNTMSTHLAILANAGLVVSRKDGRSVYYRANLNALRKLLAFLMEDCCQGRPEVCEPLLANVFPENETAALEPAVRGVPAQMDTASPQEGVQFNVLFLCTGNSARSIMAEAILNRIGAGKFRAFSAGSNPKGTVNPNVLTLLTRLGYSTVASRSKSWDEFSEAGAPALDFVFTLCDKAAREICPVWPGQPITAHWGVPSPDRSGGSEAERQLAFAEVYRMLSNRVSVFANLPLHAMDRLSLQQRLDGIGVPSPMAASRPHPTELDVR